MIIRNKEFAHRMAAKGKITKKQAKKNLKLFIDTLTDCLGEGESVRFFKFGRFDVVEIPDKAIKKIGTEEMTVVPAHNKVKFHPTEALDDLIKEQFHG